MDRKKFNFVAGPAVLITAAFIGPGTVTVCMLAGVKFQFSLLWVMVFSIFATVILQEMAARLGLVTQRGLGENILRGISNPVLRKFTLILIGVGILLGNAAFEAGNLTGTRLGIEFITGYRMYPKITTWAIVLLSGGILWFGTYRRISTFFTWLVACMSLAFLIASVATKPNFSNILSGLFSPVMPVDSAMVVVGLIGTTVVPYNLFMHAALIRDKWQETAALPAMRNDIYLSIGLGGLISACIIITGASVSTDAAPTIENLAVSLQPVFGELGRGMFGLGFFAAGFTSAITAPLAAGLVARELFGWSAEPTFWGYRITWMIVLLTGGIFASLGFKPIEIISLAQFANGLLLPVIACFLLWAVNQKSTLETHVNSLFQNVLGILVICVVLLLGWKGLSSGIQTIISMLQ